jgi:AcrR family transcriptional regulator
VVTDRVKTDRRVRRTQELLRTALITLIQQRGYERITVQDIIDEADVGRSTFYAHYRDKDDLLRSGFEDLRSVLSASAAQPPGGKAEFLHPLRGVLQHVEENRHVWKSLAGKSGAELILHILRDIAVDLLRDHLAATFPRSADDPERFESAVQYVASGFMGLTTWWLENDVPASAEEIYATFRLLTTKSVKAFLSS